MAFINTTALLELLDKEEIIKNHNPKRVINGSYQLSLGAEVFRTDSNTKEIEQISENGTVRIAPGQFALLLTEEYLIMPNHKIGFISIKAGTKFEGLINVSGFHVDPDFKGHLLFSVYNAGPSDILLKRGLPYFQLWFAELSGGTQTYDGEHDDQRHIPLKPVKALSHGTLASPNVLNEKIDKVQRELESNFEGKFNKLEEKTNTLNYLIKTGLGIIVVLGLKLLIDFTIGSPSLVVNGNRVDDLEIERTIKNDSLLSLSTSSSLPVYISAYQKNGFRTLELIK